MKYFNLIFTPTKVRRLNELVGLVMFVAAILLFLALVSYSPLDASLNTAAPGPAVAAPHNWIGITGALSSDLLLQLLGISVFIVPLMFGLLGSRWWKSRAVASPGAKSIGAVTLIVFTP